MTDRVATVPVPAGAENVTPGEREREKGFVTHFTDLSIRARRPFLEVWQEALNNYLVAMPGLGPGIFSESGYKLFGDSVRRGAGRVFLKSTDTHEMVESLASQGIGLLLSPRDYLQAVPLGIDDPEKARFVSRVIQASMEGPNNFRTIYGLLKDSFIFGTSIMELGWQTRSRLQMVRQPQVTRGVLTGTEDVQQDVTYVDAPLLRSVDIFDFYPDPAGTRIQEDMSGVCKRFRITVSQAKELAKAGVYNERGVREAIRRKREREEKRNANNSRRFDQAPELEEDSVAADPNRDDTTGLLVGLEYWGEVPWKPADNARNRVITILEDVHVRSHINPYLDGGIPFKEVVMNPINGRFWGLSPTEVVRFLQDSTDHLMQALTRGVNMASAIPLLVGSSFSGNLNQLKRRAPFDLIRCANPDAVQPIPFDFNAMQLTAQDLLRRRTQIKEASGSLDPQAISEGDRQSATEVSEIVRLASQRIELQIQIIEKDDFPWLGRTLLSRLRQFLPEEGAIAAVAGESFPFTLEDIDVEADVRFVGSRQAMSKFQKFSQMSQVLNILGTNPQLAAIYPEILVRAFRDGLDIADAEQIVAASAQRFQQFQEQQAAMQASAGGAPASQAQVSTLNQPGSAVAREGQALG